MQANCSKERGGMIIRKRPMILRCKWLQVHVYQPFPGFPFQPSHLRRYLPQALQQPLIKWHHVSKKLLGVWYLLDFWGKPLYFFAWRWFGNDCQFSFVHEGKNLIHGGKIWYTDGKIWYTEDWKSDTRRNKSDTRRIYNLIQEEKCLDGKSNASKILVNLTNFNRISNLRFSLPLITCWPLFDGLPIFQIITTAISSTSLSLR